MEFWKEDSGVHLDEIEDEEAFAEAWLEWVKTKVPATQRRRRPPPSKYELMERELAAADPLFAAVKKQFDNPKVPRSYVANHFVPDAQGHHTELDRVDKEVGRYPVGFRHYECFENYQHKYPEATIEAYVEDSKYSISFLLYI